MNKLDLKRGDELHECSEIIRQAGRNMMESFYAAGVAFKKVRDGELWKEAHESFAAYYTEMGFEKSRVSRAIRTVESLKLKTVAQMQLGKLYAILPALTLANKSELVKMAQSLSTSDLRHQLKVKRVAQVDPTLPEPPKTYPCIECGRSKGIGFPDLCRCRTSIGGGQMTKDQVKYIQTIIDKVKAEKYEV